MDGTTDKVNRTSTSLVVKDLTFAYLREAVLRGVTFRLEKGAVGLLGPNGSGKTTLLRALLGQLELPRDRVEVLGIDMALQPRRARARLGWMPERGGIIPGMSGVALVAYMGELAGMPARDAMQRAHEVLHFVGLADERYRKCDDYSQGMRQRLKLATALVHDPDWLFLDEPTSGLDPKGRVAVLELIRDLAHVKGLGVILSTHLLADVELVCHEILVLREGELLAHHDIEAAARNPRQLFEVEGFGDDEVFLTALREIAATVERDGRLYLVTLNLENATTAGAQQILAVAAASGYALRRLRRRPISLADEFYALVDGKD